MFSDLTQLYELVLTLKNNNPFMRIFPSLKDEFISYFHSGDPTSH